VPGILNHLTDGSDISNINIPVWDTALVDIKPILDYFRSKEENITVVVKMGFSGKYILTIIKYNSFNFY
jgi:hypothetical protein